MVKIFAFNRHNLRFNSLVGKGKIIRLAFLISIFEILSAQEFNNDETILKFPTLNQKHTCLSIEEI